MNAIIDKPGIPGAWELVALGDLGQWSGGGTPSKSKAQFWAGGTIPWVSPKDMKALVIRDSEDHITEEAVARSTAKLIPANSVLFVTRSGILRHSFPVAVNAVPVTVNQDLKTLTPREGVLPQYVAWALRAFSQDILDACSKQGTTVNSIETNSLKAFTIPLAPLEQQKRIVAEIEKQSSRLDEAVANLKRVKANLKRYKAAVLKAAVEGTLTEEWRKAHPDVEPASKLLDRILAERRAKWEGAELAKLQAKGKAPKNDKWKANYKEPVAPDTADLPSLPKRWVWTTVAQISSRVQYGHTASAVTRESGVRFLRITDIQEDHVDWTTVPSCDISEGEKHELLLQAGDIVFARTGATVGKSFQLKGGFPGSVFASYLIRISPHDEEISDWLSAFFHSSEYWKQIRSSQAGIGQPNVNGTKLKSVTVPFPPIPEQRRIVTELDGHLSLLREAEGQVNANLKRAKRLRQALLHSAFSGSKSL